MAMHVRKPLFAPAETIRQLFVIEAEQVQYRSMQIVDANRIARHLISEFVRLAIRHASLYATSGQPDGKTERVMVATVAIASVRSAPEFAGP